MSSSIENSFEVNGEFDFYKDIYNQIEAQQQSQPFVFVNGNDENIDAVLYSEKYNLSLEATSINSTSKCSYFKRSFQNHYSQSTSNNKFIKGYLEMPEEVKLPGL
nr:13084_t:CDS:2 [Entrophospora candida]